MGRTNSFRILITWILLGLFNITIFLIFCNRSKTDGATLRAAPEFSNPIFAQRPKLETTMTKVPSSILTGGNFVDDFAIPYRLYVSL